MSNGTEEVSRLMPVGVEMRSNGAEFRVWAPETQSAAVVFQDKSLPTLKLQSERDGYFSGILPQAQAGLRYKFALDDAGEFPDPASRYQPDGPSGYSALVDPHAFSWSDQSWQGCRLEGQVIYELHLGTFTPEGTWTSAARKIPYLKETGITVLEIMPVADFPGRFGWGYDGVQPFAPASIYGTPDDMRSFVDQAHGAGISVILDVVYNHLGPDGNYLPKFSKYYFSEKHMTDWGAGINFDGPHCRPVREYFLANAAYWIREFHLDGLRLDATQDIHDDSEPNILTEIGQAARKAAGSRSIILIGENEPQDTRLIQPSTEGGYGLDALWNDDFHHSALVALTGRADAYYTDYKGTARELLAGLKHGYLYQGQWYRWQKKRRGRPTWNTARAAMVTFIQNHDQIANSARGFRASKLTSPGKLKAVTAAALLGPGTPMLFQGQEFAASTPFLFFADHTPELAQMIRKGRIEFLRQWRSLRLPEMLPCLADPASEDTFQRSKLNFEEVETNAELYRVHRDLLRLRREDPVVSQQGVHGLDGANLSDGCFVLRYFTPDHDEDRLLLVNLGADLEFNPAPEPLLAPPEWKQWEKLWSSEDPGYGGCGTAPVDTEENWLIPGESAVLLYPIRQAAESSNPHKGKQPEANGIN